MSGDGEFKHSSFAALSDMPATPHSRPPPPPVDSGYCGLDTPRAPLRRRPVLQQASPPPLDALRPLVNNSSPSPQTLAPLVQTLVVIIFASSIGYGLLCGNRTRENLKYQAIKYGGDEASKSHVGVAVTDGESGEQLGGKRAAMQYYHDRWVRILTHLLRSKQRAGEEKEEQRRFP